MDERPGAIDASRVGSDADDGEMRFSIENMSFDFTAEELSDGIVTVYGKESA